MPAVGINICKWHLPSKCGSFSQLCPASLYSQPRAYSPQGLPSFTSWSPALERWHRFLPLTSQMNSQELLSSQDLLIPSSRLEQFLPFCSLEEQSPESLMSSGQGVRGLLLLLLEPELQTGPLSPRSWALYTKICSPLYFALSSRGRNTTNYISVNYPVTGHTRLTFCLPPLLSGIMASSIKKASAFLFKSRTHFSRWRGYKIQDCSLWRRARTLPYSSGWWVTAIIVHVHFLPVHILFPFIYFKRVWWQVLDSVFHQCLYKHFWNYVLSCRHRGVYFTTSGFLGKKTNHHN